MEFKEMTMKQLEDYKKARNVELELVQKEIQKRNKETKEKLVQELRLLLREIGEHNISLDFILEDGYVKASSYDLRNDLLLVDARY